jgi:hypothetical protein
MSVGEHEAHPNKHCPQTSSLSLVNPAMHPLISQYLAPAISQFMQLAAQALQIPLTAVYPGLHFKQNS